MSVCQFYDESDPILESLNFEQREAALFKDGACLVIAGPGTGKTHTMTSRAHFLVQDGVPPESILLMTFTKKAAREMSGRLAMLDPGCGEAQSGTFHSIAIKILREHAGCDKLSIIDEDDELTMINDYWRETIRAPNAPDPPDGAQDALYMAYQQRAHRRGGLPVLAWATERCFCAPEQFREWIRGCLDASSYAALAEMKEEEALSRFFVRYERFKKDIDKFSYDDCVIRATEFLKNNQPDLGYRYICVDEFQDSNQDQLDFIYELARDYGNIFVVGDDKQSIYCWRGAYPAVFQDFRKMFNPTEINLVENYRSTARIVDTLNSIARNRPLPSAPLRTLNEEGYAPRLYRDATLRRNENAAAQALQEIDDILSFGGNKPGDVAILFRSHYQSSQDLQLLLRQRNIPFVVVGGKAITERKIFKRLRDVMRFVNDPSWSLPIRYLAELFPNIGGAAASSLAENFAEAKTVKEFCERVDSGETLGKDTVKAPTRASIRHFQDYFLPFANLLRGFDGNSSPHSVFKKVIGCLAGLCMLDSKKDAAAYLREQQYVKSLDIMSETSVGKKISKASLGLVRSIEDFTKKRETVADWLDTMAIDEASDDGADQDRITLSTIHGAKGKEWPFVIVSDCADHLIFGKRYMKDLQIRYEHEAPRESFEEWAKTAPETIEAHNLFYVAASRAKDSLSLIQTGDFRLIDNLSGHGMTDEYGAYAVTKKEEKMGVDPEVGEMLCYRENLEQFVKDPSCRKKLKIPSY